MKGRIFLTVIFFALISASLASQTHTTVPVDASIYYFLEQAQARGLIDILPAIRPYSRSFIVRSIESILAASPQRLSSSERAILEMELQRYGQARDTGRFDLERGAYSFSALNNTRLTFDVGIGMQGLAGIGLYNDTGTYWGMENLGLAYISGDIGEVLSYDFNFFAAMIRAPRNALGLAYTYHEGFVSTPGWGDAINRQVMIYSEPLTFLPYTFKRNWDGGYFLNLGDLSERGFIEWPDFIGVGPHIISEISGTLFENILTWRFGRIRREWAGMSIGQSLTLNSMAQPFIALEAEFRPTSWFGFSSMTGVLEYLPVEGDQRSAAWGPQSLFSIEQMELNYKNYLHFGLGTTTVWGKRLELGYLFPLIPNFLYQAYVGDFDNSGLFMNIGGQVPGTGRLWFSLFIDDMVPNSFTDRTFFELDWNTYAYQFGVNFQIPWIGSFTSVTFSYTKNEPYNYTHRRIFAPWHNNNFNEEVIPLETAYINNGMSLGHYIPPNSDELLIGIRTIPAVNTDLLFQFRLVRSGASYGSRAVDGSHLLAELDPSSRRSNPVLRKFFLQDGAYRWMYVPALRAEHRLDLFGIPFTLFGGAGIVISYYTDIDGPVNSGAPSSFYWIDTPEYPASTGFIANIGFRIYM